MSGSTLVVRKRFGGEELDVREFVRPDTHMVWQLSQQLGATGLSRDDYLRRCWGYVVHSIEYPSGRPSIQDWHSMAAYRRKGSTNPALRYETNDYWNFPSETIRDKMGDCDDKSILLVSLLRRKFSSGEIFAAVGRLDGHGHMWVSLRKQGKWIVLETTRQQPAVYEEGHYTPSFRFNDRAVIVNRNSWNIPNLHTGVRMSYGQ